MGKLLANKIIKYRSDKPIKSSEEFASIVNDAKKILIIIKRIQLPKLFKL